MYAIAIPEASLNGKRSQENIIFLIQCVFGIYAPLFGKQPEQFEKVTKRPIKVSRKLLKSINGRRNKIKYASS